MSLQILNLIVIFLSFSVKRQLRIRVSSDLLKNFHRKQFLSKKETLDNYLEKVTDPLSWSCTVFKQINKSFHFGRENNTASTETTHEM